MEAGDSGEEQQRRTGAGRRITGWAVLIAVAAVLATGWGGLPRLGSLFAADAFEFAPLDDPPGFRRLAAGEVSGGFNPFAGVGGDGEAADGSADAGLCRALFGTAKRGPGAVPIAYFTDFMCPYCQVLSLRLQEIAAERPDEVRIQWHEWPILGEASEQAAKAALAAKRQGAYATFHEVLSRTSFVPTRTYLRNLAERTGVDARQLAKDMESIDVRTELARSRALARRFGFVGTPGLVVGRTAVFGSIDDARLRALIERELAEGPIEACEDKGGAAQGLGGLGRLAPT